VGRLSQTFLALLLLSACSHQVQFIKNADGTTLTGAHHIWQRTIAVTLPSGESLEGSYEPLSTGTIGEGSLFFGANIAALLGTHMSGRFHGYARLTGSQGTVLEIVFAFEWIGRGYGIARTSLGDEYRVAF